MEGMFQVSDPSEARGNSVTAREILEKASSDIDTGLARDPELQAEMMYVMGIVYRNLGLFPRAQLLFGRSAEIRRRALGPENADTLRSMDDLGWILNQPDQLTSSNLRSSAQHDVSPERVGLIAAAFHDLSQRKLRMAPGIVLRNTRVSFPSNRQGAENKVSFCAASACVQSDHLGARPPSRD